MDDGPVALAESGDALAHTRVGFAHALGLDAASYDANVLDHRTYGQEHIMYLCRRFKIVAMRRYWRTRLGGRARQSAAHARATAVLDRAAASRLSPCEDRSNDDNRLR